MARLGLSALGAEKVKCRRSVQSPVLEECEGAVRGGAGRGVVTANGRQYVGSKTIQLVSLLPVETGNPILILCFRASQYKSTETPT